MPMFGSALIGLVSISILFFSYVTAQLAVREATSAAIHDRTLTIDQVRSVACNSGFQLWPSLFLVQVEPPDTSGVSCSNPNIGTGAQTWPSGAIVSVSSFYTVPLPTIKIPLNNSGSAVLMAPIRIKAVSVMTFE
jgi:hypothetical protein